MTAARRQRITLVPSPNIPNRDLGGILQKFTPLEVREVDLPNSLELRSKVSFDHIFWGSSGRKTGGTYSTIDCKSFGVTGFWVQTRTNLNTILEGDRTVSWTWANMSGGISRTLKFLVVWELSWCYQMPLQIESDRLGTAVKILRPDEFFDGEDGSGLDPWSTVIERLSGGCEKTRAFVLGGLSKSRNKPVEDKIEIGGLWTSAKFSQVSVLNRRFPRLDIKVE